jgi:glycosyltransferase involved in cell wall biosynthesis
MRIGMVLAKPFPPDIRVEKEANALIAAGFTVGLLAKSMGEGSDLGEETADRLKIYRAVVPSESVWKRNVKGFTLMERLWVEPLRQFIADLQPDVLHVHDFPFVKTVLSVAEPLGLPVVADLHENMPAALRIWRTSFGPVKRAKDAIFRNYHLWRWYERQVLPRCIRIIVVVPEAAERLYDYGLDKDRITVVSNTEDESSFPFSSPDPDIVERYRHQWVIGYVGGIGPHRGVDTAIQAVALSAQQIPNLRLLIVGAKGGRVVHSLTRLSRRLGVEESVDIIGWQPFETVASYIAACAACLVPHNNSEHTQTTVPHKLFQYMIIGKPVIVSDVRPLKRIVEETRSGLVFAADDPSDLARALLELYRAPALGSQLGSNGQRAATGPYCWRHDAQRLIDLYRDLEESEQHQ